MAQFKSATEAMAAVRQEVDGLTFDPAKGFFIQKPGFFFLISAIVLEYPASEYNHYSVQVELLVDEVTTDHPDLNAKHGCNITCLRNRSSTQVLGYPLNNEYRLWFTCSTIDVIWVPWCSGPSRWYVLFPVRSEFIVHLGSTAQFDEMVKACEEPNP